MDLGSDILCCARTAKSYDVFVYMFIFLNYFSLIIFIIFASLYECKVLPGWDWQLWQMSQGAQGHFPSRSQSCCGEVWRHYVTESRGSKMTVAET